MASRQALHSMLDDVPEHLLPIAEVSLLRLGKLGDDPFWRALAEAAESDEALTTDDVAAIAAGWESFAGRRGITSDALDRLLA
jgi:hypothetical protein